MEKIDARRLHPEARNEIRKMVIRLRQQSGMTYSQLAQIAGVHEMTVQKWLHKAKQEGVGSLTEKPRGRPVGSCRKITLAQEQWLREVIVGFIPKQMVLPFALWTRPAIKALIRQKFGIEMSDRLIGKYLKRWGFTPQRPIKRALEQRPELIETWLKESYPEIEAKAKREGAVIFFGDETAVKEDSVWIRGFAPKGETPVLAKPNRWDKLSMISAISAKGEIAFKIIDGGFNAERFVEFLESLIEDATRKIILIVDNLKVHKAAKVKEWLKDKKDRIELAFLPPYAPESNPDEYLNSDFKTNLRLGVVSENREQLLEKAITFMNKLTTWPERVRSYFQHPSAKYAANPI
jgi:transposase